MTYRLLDLYCGAGGAAKGYYTAGFSEIVGVDIELQPNYPFEFWQMSAISLNYEQLLSFDFIHASPPCQQYSKASAVARKRGKVYPDLIEPTRLMLVASGKPYVMENVPGAPIRPDICLCGSMFGLGVLRHRLFETNIRSLVSHLTCQHSGRVLDGDYVTVAGNGGSGEKRLSRWREAMGIDWMTRDEIREAIPPAYTQHIGEMVLSMLMNGTMSIEEIRAGSHLDVKSRLMRPVESPEWAFPVRLPGF